MLPNLAKFVDASPAGPAEPRNSISVWGSILSLSVENYSFFGNIVMHAVDRAAESLVSRFVGNNQVDGHPKA
ncbi:MAG: hypothetical protein WBX06_12760 [Acidobacteriaceae bacterium]